MAGSSHEKVLAAEWLAIMSVETLDALSGADSGKFSLPSPARYFATMIVFLMLAGMAMFGEHAGKLAAAFGGVAAIGIAIAPGAGGKQSPVVGAFNYFDKLMSQGPAVPGGSSNPPAAQATLTPAQTATLKSKGLPTNLTPQQLADLKFLHVIS